MNITKIEWTDFSWNPITGCKHGCWYCYAKKLATRGFIKNNFEPTFYPSRLKQPYERKKPAKIFVCSVADLFAPWTPLQWRMEVMNSMLWCPIKHEFQMLTKNPENIPKYDQFEYPDNFWFGATVNGGEYADSHFIDIMKNVDAGVRFISFEPLLGPVDVKKYSLDGLDWIIIGKLTGSRKVELKDEWVNDIFENARNHNIPVFMKNNLIDAYKGLYWMQEFPVSKG